LEDSVLTIIKYFIPVCIFIAGSLFTLLLKKIESDRKGLEAAVKESVRLSKDWYGQIQKLSDSDKLTDLDRFMESRVFEYLHNRLILPDFLLNLSILQHKSKATPLVRELETFLSRVTNFDPRNPGELIYCHFIGEEKIKRRQMQGKEWIQKRNELLDSLDGIIQRIVKESAKLLK
jgi:hypothetical protein